MQSRTIREAASAARRGSASGRASGVGDLPRLPPGSPAPFSCPPRTGCLAALGGCARLVGAGTYALGIPDGFRRHHAGQTVVDTRFMKNGVVWGIVSNHPDKAMDSQGTLTIRKGR